MSNDFVPMRDANGNMVVIEAKTIQELFYDGSLKIYGMVIEEIIELRCLYEVLNGEYPITGEKIREMINRFGGGAIPKKEEI